MKTQALIASLILGAVSHFAPSACRAQAFDDFAPVVVKTVPEPGSMEVPPGEFEVKVTFNKEMQDHSWSWCTVWDNSTPEGTNGPRYEADLKTCVLKVKLEPDKIYGYWLNSGRFRHFQDKEGRSAVPYLLVFGTKGSHPPAAEKPDGLIATNGVPASETIETRLGHALSESSPGKREAELDRIQRDISLDDIPAALALLAKKGVTSVHSTFGEVAAKWASKDAGAAIAWATNVPDANIRKSAIVSMLKGWTQVSPEAAAAYTFTLPEGELHDDAVMMVVNEWSFRDSHGAADWVSHLPKSALRDKAVGPIIFWGQGQAPAAVAEMLDTIGDMELIQKNGESLASIWLRRDDIAARAWIKKSPLSEEVKQRLLNQNE